MKPFASFVLLLLFMLPAPTHAAGARLRINELNANLSNGCDLVELRVVGCGDMNGIQLWDRAGPLVTFSAFDVGAESFIVVHLSGGSLTCNPLGATSETTSPVQQPAAQFPGNFDTAYDWYSTVAGLASATNVLAVYDAGGAIMDAVLLSDATSLPAALTQTAADNVVAAGQWTPTNVTGSDFITNAANDLNATGALVTGTTIQRVDNTDDNDRFDWTSGAGAAPTWGAFNAGQSAAFNCATAVGETTPRSVLRVEARPSVALGRTRFYSSLSSSEPGRVEIFDASGRATAVLWLLPGARSVEWDGRDRLGRAAPAGPYFVRLVTSKGSAVTRVTLLH